MRRYDMEILEEQTILELKEDIDEGIIIDLCEEYLIECIENYYYHHGRIYLPFTVIEELLKEHGDNRYSCKFSVYRNDPEEYADPEFDLGFETEYCVELYDSYDKPKFPIHCGEATIFLRQDEEGLKLNKIEPLINEQLYELRKEDPDVANELLDWYYEPKNQTVYFVDTYMDYDGDDDEAFKVVQSEDGYIDWR